MSKIKFFLTLFSFFLLSCNTDNNTSLKINEVFENYYQENLKLYPLNATRQGDIRYNDFLPNNLTDEFRNKEKIYYLNYVNQLNKFDDNKLNEDDKLSKKVMLWECTRNLERLDFNEHLTPINQMWTLQLDIGQFAAGLSAQPFKTIKDYNNWLKRIDDYLLWLKSVEDRMREGIENGHVLPKSLIKKVIPQLEVILNPDLNLNLFYSPIRQFPSFFSDKEKSTLKKDYKNMVLNKIIPAYKVLHEFMK
ncbi:MAG: DUF885 family protein, partial [Flavobacteriaceae bacterium]|nr:DUF885 family protein [Flavobacteriaceae bacterium]